MTRPEITLPYRKCATKPSVQFEFDPRKSESNKAKHGIDFVEAQALWKSKHVLLGAKDASEKRYRSLEQFGASIGRRLSPIAEGRFGLLVLGNQLASRLRRMKKSQADSTTAKNIEEKFERGEDVLDYFDVRKARVIMPSPKSTAAKTKFA